MSANFHKAAVVRESVLMRNILEVLGDASTSFRRILEGGIGFVVTQCTFR